MTRTAGWRRIKETDEVLAPEPVLDLRSVSVRYLTSSGLNTAVTDVSIKVEPGEFVSIVGRSGCGKSTLLHVAAGLIRPAAGKVSYLGQEWTGLHPDVGYVTQKDTLLPWCTVLDNIALPLKLHGVRRAERRRVAGEMAVSLGLGEYLKHFPSQLSGGMRQRAQLGRTLVTRPKLLLMDEPFGALDAYLRMRMQELLVSILREHPVSTVFVTHDLGEAITLSDRVVALSGAPGRLALDCVIETFTRRDDLMAIRGTPEFSTYQSQLWETISSEGSQK
ncbi:MAG: NitT/TauT family transport system ATP-binding protein [Mycobacteriales bacterium]|jgi:NitT/TauT family transport system ATP-binding protein